MQLDYFYGAASEHFRFYQIPALLLEEDCYRKLRDTSKLLYGVLLSQLSLSRKNGWTEPDTGRIYIHYNLRYLAQCLGHSANTITRSMQELCEAGLLQRRRRGRGLPDILYVMDFTTIRETKKGAPKESAETGHDQTAENGMKEDGEASKTNGSHPEAIQKETGSIKKDEELPELMEKKAGKDISVTEIYRDILKEQIGYPYLVKNNPLNTGVIEDILSVMVEVFTTQRKNLRVNGEDRSVNEIQNRLKRIDISHMEYILQCLAENTKKIVNPPSFLLTVLYNAPATINTYYNALAARDISRGFFAGAETKEGLTEDNRQGQGRTEETAGLTEKADRKGWQEGEYISRDANDRYVGYDTLEELLLRRENQEDTDKGG